MNTADLKAAILADQIAKDFADAGNDTAAALRINEIAPSEIQELRVSYRTIMGLVNLKAAGQLKRTMLGVIAGGTVPGVIDEDQLEGLKTVHDLLDGEIGVDVGNAESRAMLDFFALNEALPLELETATAIKALAEHRPRVTHQDVSLAWAEFRNN